MFRAGESCGVRNLNRLGQERKGEKGMARNEDMMDWDGAVTWGIRWGGLRRSA